MNRPKKNRQQNGERPDPQLKNNERKGKEKAPNVAAVPPDASPKPPKSPNSGLLAYQEENKFIDSCLKQRGLCRVLVPKDGSCLFRAVADAVLLCQQRHMVARLQCVEFLGSHEEFFAPFIEYDDKIKTFEQYLAEMSKEFTWGGNVELQVLSQLYGISFTIYEYKKLKGVLTERSMEILADSPKTKLTLAYTRGNHYDIVVSLSHMATLSICQSIIFEMVDGVLGNKEEPAEHRSFENISWNLWLGIAREQDEADRKQAEKETVVQTILAVKSYKPPSENETLAEPASPPKELAKKIPLRMSTDFPVTPSKPARQPVITTPAAVVGDVNSGAPREEKAENAPVASATPAWGKPKNWSENFAADKKAVSAPPTSAAPATSPVDVEASSALPEKVRSSAEPVTPLPVASTTLTTNPSLAPLPSHPLVDPATIDVKPVNVWQKIPKSVIEKNSPASSTSTAYASAPLPASPAPRTSTTSSDASSPPLAATSPSPASSNPSNSSLAASSASSVAPDAQPALSKSPATASLASSVPSPSPVSVAQSLSTAATPSVAPAWSVIASKARTTVAPASVLKEVEHGAKALQPSTPSPPSTLSAAVKPPTSALKDVEHATAPSKGPVPSAVQLQKTAPNKMTPKPQQQRGKGPHPNLPSKKRNAQKQEETQANVIEGKKNEEEKLGQEELAAKRKEAKERLKIAEEQERLRKSRLEHQPHKSQEAPQVQCAQLAKTQPSPWHLQPPQAQQDSADHSPIEPAQKSPDSDPQNQRSGTQRNGSIKDPDEVASSTPQPIDELSTSPPESLSIATEPPTNIDASSPVADGVPQPVFMPFDGFPAPYYLQQAASSYPRYAYPPSAYPSPYPHSQRYTPEQYYAYMQALQQQQRAYYLQNPAAYQAALMNQYAQQQHYARQQYSHAYSQHNYPIPTASSTPHYPPQAQETLQDDAQPSTQL